MGLGRFGVMLAVAWVAIGAAPLGQDIYIWQRLWTPGVTRAAWESRSLFSGWRVLAAETDPNGRLRSFAINWDTLKGKPVTAVIRIDGALGALDQPSLLSVLRQITARWPKTVALEIDYDCATAQLIHYTTFLKAVRKSHPQRLAITALPTWLSSPDLAALLAVPDESVLQVHAVRAPSQGLFDAKLARRWIDRFDAITAKSFRVALPDYGTRVIRSQGGSVIAMESENPKLMEGASAEELLASPEDVAALVRDLAKTPPRHLAGLTWFRLPVAGDQRIWSLQTLAQVMLGEAGSNRPTIKTRPGASAGVVDVLLVNPGTIDVVLPLMITLPTSCKTADGIGAYRYEGQKFRRLQNAFLPGHHQMVIGWARCGVGEFHVEP